MGSLPTKEQSRDAYCQAAKAAPKRPSPLSDEPRLIIKSSTSCFMNIPEQMLRQRKLPCAGIIAPSRFARFSLDCSQCLLSLFRIRCLQLKEIQVHLHYNSPCRPLQLAIWCISCRQHHAFCFEVSPSTINPARLIFHESCE